MKSPVSSLLERQWEEGQKQTFQITETSVDILLLETTYIPRFKTVDINTCQVPRMAAPIIAGIIGLSKSMNPDLSHQKLKEILIDSSDRLPILKDMAVGGRANAYKMLISTP